MLKVSWPGTACGVCLADKQVVKAEFQDGLSGQFCWSCLGKMVRARAKGGGSSAHRGTGGKAAGAQPEQGL
jgi:hypothetical protein